MLLCSKILFVGVPLSVLLQSALVNAFPRQTAAALQPRQTASTDTIDAGDDEDPDVEIDNTDKLRKGMD